MRSLYRNISLSKSFLSFSSKGHVFPLSFPTIRFFSSYPSTYPLSSPQTAATQSIFSSNRYRDFSSSANVNPGAHKDRKSYHDNMKIFRKKYMAEYKKQKAKKDAEDENKANAIREAKRKTLLYKRELQKLSTEKAAKKLAAIRERFELRLKVQQEIRDKKNVEYEKKIKNLLGTLYKESGDWITLENIDQKIGPHLFANAGSSTGLVTDKSIQWKYLAIPDVPDFTEFRDDDLFDIKEDSHFLTTRSPYLQDLEIPPESIYYTPGIITKRDMVEEENKKLSADEKVQISLDEGGLSSSLSLSFQDSTQTDGESIEGDKKDTNNNNLSEEQQKKLEGENDLDFEEKEDEEDDGFIYMEDAIYRPMDNADISNVLVSKGHRESSMTGKHSNRLDAIQELNMVTNLAEKYEELLYSQLEDEDRISDFLDKKTDSNKDDANEKTRLEKLEE